MSSKKKQKRDGYATPPLSRRSRASRADPSPFLGDEDSSGTGGAAKTPPATTTTATSELRNRRANSSRSPVGRRSRSNGNQEDGIDEMEDLRRQLHDLQEEKRHHEAIVSALASQNWDYLIDRSRRIQRRFNDDMEMLIKDIQALCDFSHDQKALSSSTFTPSRIKNSSSRLSSSSVPSPPLPVVPIVARSSRADGASHGAHKEFSWRDSQLTTMFRISPDMQTVYNMFVAVLILFALKLAINEYFTVRSNSADQLSIMLLIWNFAEIVSVTYVWVSMFLFHSLILIIMWSWRSGLFGDLIYGLLYLCHQLCFSVAYALIIVRMNLPVACSLILLCEQVRMIMKCHSFWRETIRIKHSPNGADQPEGILLHEHSSASRANTTLLPTFEQQASQFFFFHFVPTLIYRNVYPRTRHIRWGFVATCSLEVVGCVIYIYVIFANYCVPEFRNTASNPGDVKSLFVSLFNSVLPGIGVYLLAFFGLLHSWMNLFGELTRFADRLFYTEWWNVSSFSAYYRRWNMIVHDHLFNYVYLDLKKLGAPMGVCFFATFLISALVHEYIIALSLKFFYPVMLVLFLGFGVFFVYLTRMVSTSSRAWNVFFWTNLIVGNGILMIAYSREYYARQPAALGTTPTFNFDPNSWLPYSWQPFLR